MEIIKLFPIKVFICDKFFLIDICVILQKEALQIFGEFRVLFKENGGFYIEKREKRKNMNG